MSQHIPTIERTVSKTYEWVAIVGREMGADPEEALAALRATLQALRDRLPIDEAAQLAAQLPILVRGLFYEGWNPSAKPSKDKTRDDFLVSVARKLGKRRNFDIEHAARAVFTVLGSQISEGEMADVASSLPLPVRELWPGHLSAMR